MFLTVAGERADDGDIGQWIRDLQEIAFSLASETERRTATALASEWMAKNITTTTSAAAEPLSPAVNAAPAEARNASSVAQ